VKAPFRIRNALLTTSVALGVGLGYFYITDTRANIHKWLAVPLIRVIWPDAEDAHSASIHGLETLYRWGLHPRERGDPDGSGDLRVDVFGYTLDNPLGISSGLDKNAVIPSQLFALGPAVIEIGASFSSSLVLLLKILGGVTPLPQVGNARPRIFRLKSQEGLVNRCGMNSEGAAAVVTRLRRRVLKFGYLNGYDAEAVLNGDAGVPPGSLIRGKLLAIQVAKQETTPEDDIEAIKQDFVSGTKALSRYADIITVNVSCPNARYRQLQQIEPLTNILTGVVTAARQTKRKVKPAVMVKVSPDEDSEEQITNICIALCASNADGIIVGNTTVKWRPTISAPGTRLSKKENAAMLERGGYSGPQMFERTLALVLRYRRILDQVAYQHTAGKRNGSEIEPQKVIFCTGGITSGKQALKMLHAGCSVAQIYTGQILVVAHDRC
jgi:dihydroorotate dehydrogenase